MSVSALYFPQTRLCSIRHDDESHGECRERRALKVKPQASDGGESFCLAESLTLIRKIRSIQNPATLPSICYMILIAGNIPL